MVGEQSCTSLCHQYLLIDSEVAKEVEAIVLHKQACGAVSHLSAYCLLVNPVISRWFRDEHRSKLLGTIPVAVLYLARSRY